MELKNFLSAILVSSILLGAIFTCSAPVQAKKWTPQERQDKLMQEINAGQKSKELTVAEAKKLRKDLSHIARKEAKLRRASKQNGKLSPDDASNMESQLNKV
ncbi:MAG: hypothetical protein K2X81_17165, partial [Candidatus Obscuribacterales bacterium]|nr:hypothetical protein [Candidatus Obscuribacterales bacterium]